MTRQTIMVHVNRDNAPPLARNIVDIAGRSDRSPLSIGLEMLRRALPPQRLFPAQYLSFGLWRAELAAREKAQYVGLSGSRRINAGLISRGADNRSAVLACKYFTAILADQIGLATPRILAAFARDAGFGSVPMLRDRAALAAFLRHRDHHPCYGKPVDGSRGNGSVWIRGAGAAGELILGDDRRVSADDVADEVVTHFPQGWLIQELVRPRPEISAVMGPALGMFRVVTIWPSDAPPRVLYAVWSLPPPKAQNDATASSDNGIAEIDPESGRIVRVNWAKVGGGDPGAVSAASPGGTPARGFVIPGFDALSRKLCQFHAMLPGHGLLGFDATITDHGPLITEVNSSPFHTVYQMASGLPFATPERMALLADVANGVRARAAKPGPDRRRWWT